MGGRDLVRVQVRQHSRIHREPFEVFGVYRGLLLGEDGSPEPLPLIPDFDLRPTIKANADRPATLSSSGIALSGES